MTDWGEKLELKINMLPESPGCYMMKNQAGEIIYVGKAVNLKNRVRSYFRDTFHTPKVAAMISHIDDFEILLCETNLEALMLECNLIKRYMPYYNILLKDDKHYPYLKMNLKEAYPRLILTREMQRDGAVYFGPYIGASSVKQVLESVRKIFPLRTCKMTLPASGTVRPCMNYEVGRCMAPCAGKCTEQEYRSQVDGVVHFLNGDYRQILAQMKEDMTKAASTLHYERAARIRDQMRDVQLLMERQIAQQTEYSEQDLIAIAQDGLDAMVQILYVRGGKMVGGDHFLLEREGGEDPGEVLQEFVLRYYETATLIPRNLLCQSLPDGSLQTVESYLRQMKGSAVTVNVPQRGEKHDLVLLAMKNADDALKKRNARKNVKEERTKGAAENLGKIIGMQRYPRRIEGYDISNTQGEQSVAAMVTFIDGEAAKKEYRHFRIRTVEGANDFASIYEVISRRFKRYLEERPSAGFGEFPDMVLIDGGPQQLSFALKALQDLQIDPPAMFGLAEREEEIWLPDAQEPICLDHHTPELQLVQRIRDEAHRFGISYHRQLRTQASVHSALDDIPGIGPARRRELLKAFGSIKQIREAEVEALAKVKGMNKTAAENVKTALAKDAKT